MTLVERLRALANWHEHAGHRDESNAVRAAIARIEAADALDGELPATWKLDATDVCGMSSRDTNDAIRAYRALVREQDGG